MKFTSPPRLVSRGGLYKFLEADFWTWANQLFLGMSRLTFEQNFDSFRVDNLKLEVNVDTPISNQLKQKQGITLPSSWIVVRQKGYGLITDGDADWTINLLYLKNHGPDAVTISVIFFR